MFASEKNALRLLKSFWIQKSLSHFSVAEATDNLASLGEESGSNNFTLPSPPLNGSGSPDM
jgi:hypothetical protein